MNKRHVNEFRIGEKVGIDFGHGRWQRAVVIVLEHQGLWVHDGQGGRWFVTNTQRIRRQQNAT